MRRHQGSLLFRAGRAATSLLPVLGVLGCDAHRGTSTRPAAAAEPPDASPPAVISAPAPPAPSASVVAAPADASSAAEPAPLAKPEPVTRAGTEWPFHRWDRAEAVAFNQFPMRPSTQLRAYDDHGWSPDVVDRKPIDDAHAKEAVELVKRSLGDVEVSKCPFPRHAVVLYEGATPVASINVCFECGDIVLWPPWAAPPEWDKLSTKQLKERELLHAKQMKRYDQVFPRWKTFFRDDLGFPIDAKYH